MLRKENAEIWANFYDDYSVFDAVKNDSHHRKYGENLWANMLRSEHIPYNVFFPFNTERALFCATAAAVFGVNPAELPRIIIEYAPKPAEDYLKDRTAFDVFCECKDHHGDPFFIAVELKYTEGAYSIGDKERKDCRDPASVYNSFSRESGLYLPQFLETEIPLKKNEFRQVWRNHLLAEKLRKVKNYKYYKSVILYPSANRYYSKIVEEYPRFLKEDHAHTFVAITFEKFFAALGSHASSARANDWVAYLGRRYIPEIHSAP